MIVIDMELPKTWRSCNLSFDAYGSITEGKCAALRCGVTYMNDRRNPICPIVGEIPDKHGRLIDLDAYLKASENMAEWEEYRVEEIEEYFENCPVIVEASR